MSLLDRYQDALRNIPPPGTGYHPALLGVANLGLLAGLSPEEIREDIQPAITQDSQF